MYFQGHPTTVPERFAWILSELVKAVRAQGGSSRVLAVVWPALWNRVMAVSRAVVEVIAAIENGTVRPWRARRRRVCGSREVSQEVRDRMAALGRLWGPLPTGFRWLLPLLHWTANALASQLTHLLQEPEVKRLLAASPRLGIALRPVCRMLGIDPSFYEGVVWNDAAEAAVDAADVAGAAHDSVPEENGVAPEAAAPAEGGGGKIAHVIPLTRRTLGNK